MKNIWNRFNFMQPIILVSLYFVLMVPSHAFAFAREGFYLEQSLWLATDIVVVDREVVQGKTIYQVVDVWRGSLEKGHRFDENDFVFELDQHEPIDWRTDRWERDSRKLNRDRFVVFLRDLRVVEDERTDQAKADGKSARRWLPANEFKYDDFDRASVWLDNGTAYWLYQSGNPGPLHPYSEFNEVGLRLHVMSHDLLMNTLRRAIEDGDADTIASAAAEALKREHTTLTRKAFGALKDIGKPAFTAVRQRLLNDKKLYEHPASSAIIRLFGTVGQDAAQDELIMIIDNQFYYFSKDFEDKTDDFSNWWEYGYAADRHANLVAALRSLSGLHSEEAIEIITDVRDLFRDNPELHVKSNKLTDYGDVAKLCEGLLKQPAEEQ